MKIVNIETGRMGIVAPIDEFLPLTGAYPPDIWKAIAERYSFVSRPDMSLALSEIRENGFEFQFGKFQALDSTEQSILKLVVFGFGIAANGYSTESAEMFLDDLCRWADDALGFRFSSSRVSVFFLSQIVVEFQGSLESATLAFNDASNRIHEAFKDSYGIQAPMHVSAVTIDYDRVVVPDEIKQLATFTIQRQVGQPYAANRFFCQAPLRTRDHVRLLEEIECVLARDYRK